MYFMQRINNEIIMLISDGRKWLLKFTNRETWISRDIYFRPLRNTQLHFDDEISCVIYARGEIYEFFVRVKYFQDTSLRRCAHCNAASLMISKVLISSLDKTFFERKFSLRGEKRPFLSRKDARSTVSPRSSDVFGEHKFRDFLTALSSLISQA